MERRIAVFFSGWENLGRVVVMAVCAYVALIAILRISGKRTLSKMNAFDFVVTVALGSTLATIIVSKDLVLGEGVVALAMLVRSEPTLLLYRGEFLRDAMKAQRVTETEVRHAGRSQGADDLAECAVVLENDGRFSVLPAGGRAAEPAMRDVEAPRHERA